MRFSGGVLSSKNMEFEEEEEGLRGCLVALIQKVEGLRVKWYL